MRYINKILSLIKRLHIWELKETEGFKKYTANISWLFFGQLVSMAAAFFVSARVAAYLGPSDYGLLSYVLSAVGLFSFLGTLGVDSILVRELVKHREHKDALLGTSFFLKVFGSLLAMVAVCLAALLIEKDRWTFLLIFVSSFIFLLQSINVVSLYFQSMVQSQYAVNVQVAASIISAAVKVIFIILGLPLIYFVVSYLIDAFILGVGMLIMFEAKAGNMRFWKFDFALAKKILRDSLWLILNGAMVVIYIRIDQVIVKLLLGNSQAGYYAVAVKLAEMFYFIPSLLYTAVFPAVVSAHDTDTARFHRRLAMFYGLMFWLSIILALPVYFLAGFIISFLFGSDFLSSIPAMRIYIWAMVPIFLGNVLTSYMVTKNLLKLLLFWNFVGAAVNVSLNFILIPRMGILGAAWATIIAYAFPLVGLLLSTRENMGQIKYMVKGMLFLPFIKKEGNEIV